MLVSLQNLLYIFVVIYKFPAQPTDWRARKYCYDKLATSRGKWSECSVYIGIYTYIMIFSAAFVLWNCAVPMDGH